MSRAPSKKQQQREKIVLTYYRDCGFNFEKAEAFDRVVCDALGLDAAATPPMFLADAMTLG